MSEWINVLSSIEIQSSELQTSVLYVNFCISYNKIEEKREESETICNKIKWSSKRYAKCWNVDFRFQFICKKWERKRAARDELVWLKWARKWHCYKRGSISWWFSDGDRVSGSLCAEHCGQPLQSPTLWMACHKNKLPVSTMLLNCLRQMAEKVKRKDPLLCSW